MLRPLNASLALLAFGAALLPATAGAYVTPQAAQTAADRAVGWYAANQSDTGNVEGFGGDWSMIALANAGKNAADLKKAASPSLQDFYAGSWSDPATSGPGTVSTDQARALLVGHGGGIRGAKLSASRNLVARQLRFFNGSQLGFTSTVNDDMFGLLALQRSGVNELAPALDREVRRAQTEGGWNYTSGGGAADTDMTGAGIGTLCANGATPDDPAVAQGLDFLEGKQDPATGGFISDFFGVNSDSTGWAINGLRECGIDPQSARWTTASGKTPLDFLLAQQKTNGAFRWKPSEPDDNSNNLYATQDAITGLVGEGFGAEPAPRETAGDPAFRPAPAVADGTQVPMGLVIDHGPAASGAERACSVEAPAGGTVADLLRNAGQADPENCATGVQIASNQLQSVNGVAAAGARRWELSVDGKPASGNLDQEIGLGSVVSAKLVGPADAPAAAPQASELRLPPVTPVRAAAPARAKVALSSAKRLRIKRGRVALTVSCPRGLGAAGCRGVARVTYKAGRKTKRAGAVTYSVASGQRKAVRVTLTRAFRKLVAESRRGRVVTIEAVTRDEATRSATRTTRSVRILGR